MIHKDIISWICRRWSERDGNAAVELALVAPFLLVVLMGIVDFGRVLYFRQVLTTAARESSRASATGFEPYISAANRVLSPAGIPSPSASCSGNPSLDQTTICRTVQNILVDADSTQAHRVDITYNVQYITPLRPLLNIIGGNTSIGPGIILTSTAVMRE